MDRKSLTENPPSSPDDENSGIAFTSASPLEGYAYGTSKISTNLTDNSTTLICDKGQPSFLSNKPSSPRTTALQPFTSPPVTLFVGGSLSPSTETHTVPFYVHADLLTSVSSFFRAAFGTKSQHTRSDAGRSFTEALTRTMRLPEERPEDVSYLMQWVYWRALHKDIVIKSQGSGTLPAGGLWHEEVDPKVQRYAEYVEAKRLLEKTLGEDNGSIKQLKRPKPPAFGPLVRLYVLADKFDVRELKSELCRRVREVGKDAKCVPDREDVDILWNEVVAEGADTGLKHEVVEMYAGLGSKSFRNVFLADGEDEEWCQGFMADLVLRMFARWENLRGRRKGGKRKGNEGVVGLEVGLGYDGSAIG